MKILLADDNRQFCFILKEYLEKKKKHHVSLAFDGDEARYAIKNDIYDIIFLDCDMPRLSGVDLIRIIKKDNPETVIIMISGYEGIEKTFAKRLGAKEFLRKPFPIKRIDEVLNKYGPR